MPRHNDNPSASIAGCPICRGPVNYPNPYATTSCPCGRMYATHDGTHITLFFDEEDRPGHAIYRFSDERGALRQEAAAREAAQRARDEQHFAWTVWRQQHKNDQ